MARQGTGDENQRLAAAALRIDERFFVCEALSRDVLKETPSTDVRIVVCLRLDYYLQR